MKQVEIIWGSIKTNIIKYNFKKDVYSACYAVWQVWLGLCNY
jgi:hypothetical protein